MGIEMRGDLRSNLEKLLNPKAVAIVGATPRSSWAKAAIRNLQTLGFAGHIFPVNRRAEDVAGYTAFRSCAEIPTSVDVALLVVPPDAILELLDDLAAAKIGFAVILAGGFAELGEQGRLSEVRVREKAQQLGIRLVGPNCLGVANFLDRGAAWAGGLSKQTPGPMAIVSQSGAVAISIHRYALQQGVAHSHLVSTGNEIDVDVVDAIRFLIRDDRVKVIALFLETIRRPLEFKRACVEALAAGKPIVVLKVGRSEHTAKAAQAHTGALVGDDKVFDGFCRQFGLIRTDSIEEMVHTAEVFLRTEKLSGRRAAIISMSGGLAEISADLAGLAGVSLSEFSTQTASGLREFLPHYASVNNPLDLTGLATTEPGIAGKAVSVVAQDPDTDFVIYVMEVPEGENDKAPFGDAMLASVSTAAGTASKPVLVMSHQVKVVSNYGSSLIEQLAIPYVSSGLQYGMRALASVSAWQDTRRRRQDLDALSPKPGHFSVAAKSLATEFAAQEFLRSVGVPVVPTKLAKTHEEAAKAAGEIDGKVVLKVCSAQIAHKSEVGGVRIGIAGDQAADEFKRLLESVSAARPDAVIDGVLVSPMRQPGIELIVGVTRDPQWGPVLAVGLGGIFVELLQDSSTRLLPVGPSEVRQMFEELSGARILKGFRGIPAANLDLLVDVVCRISNAALRIEKLDTLEVNPLRVRGSEIEVLDALVISSQE